MIKMTWHSIQICRVDRLPGNIIRYTSRCVGMAYTAFEK